MPDYYSHGGYPAQGAPGASVDARSEFISIAAAFAKLPAITASALRLIRVNAGATALESVTLATATVETYADAQAGTHHRLGSVAGTNAITAQATPTLTAYVTGQTFQCESAGANTTAVTANIDSVGVRNLNRPDGSALQPGDIPAANYPMALQVRAADIVLLNPYNEVSAPLHAATAKGTIVDADEGGLVDSAASWVLKKWTFANLWTWIQTHAGTTYAALNGSITQGFSANWLSIESLDPGTYHTETDAGAGLKKWYMYVTGAKYRMLLLDDAGTPTTQVFEIDRSGNIVVTGSVVGGAAGASTTVPGNVELATSAETQTGTDVTRAVTPAGFADASLGYNQSWQDVAASRTYGSTYTNTTGKPIQVAITVANSVNNGTLISLTIDSVVVGQVGHYDPNIQYWQLTGIVPPGKTYLVSGAGGSKVTWAELRT